jgi:CSLREA domain-containing protein
VSRPARAGVLVFLLLLSTALTPALAAAATFTVTDTADSNSGTCVPGACTLRQAVLAANASPGSTVALPAGHYPLKFGELQLLADVTIDGAGPTATTIAQTTTARIFNVPGAAVTARIEGVAVERGIVAGTSALQAHGGGISNSGTLTLADVVVRNNVVRPADNTGTTPEGGGIFNTGVLHVVDSRIEGNRATSLPYTGGIPAGAGIENQGQVDLTDSVIARNSTVNESGIPEGAGLTSIGPTAHGAAVTLTRVLVDGNRVLNLGTGGFAEGGGIWAYRTDLTILESSFTGNEVVGGAIAVGGGFDVFREGDFILERSLVADNAAESGTFSEGAGVRIDGTTTELQRVVNSTITGNRGVSPGASTGAGIMHYGGARMEVVSSTISGNRGEGGGKDLGGNLNDNGAEGSVLTLRDSIVSGGVGAAGGENCSGSGVQSAGHNIDSLDQCNFHAAGDKVNTDPLLAALARNGGPTETLGLLPGSPAIDAGDACPATDQRGIARPQGAACDLGAYELVPPPVPPTTTPLLPTTTPPPKVGRPSGAAKFKLLAGTVKVSLKTGVGTVSSRCQNVAGDRCQVTLALTAPAPKAVTGARAKTRLRVGSATATIAGGATGKLRVKLTAKGLALLQASAGHQLQLAVAGKSSNDANQAVTVKAALALKASG